MDNPLPPHEKELGSRVRARLILGAAILQIGSNVSRMSGPSSSLVPRPARFSGALPPSLIAKEDAEQPSIVNGDWCADNEVPPRIHSRSMARLRWPVFFAISWCLPMPSGSRMQ